MEQYFPIFPLKLVAYPNEEINLHIFEERYKELINECFDAQINFAIPVHLNNKIMDYGTEVELEAIRKTYEDGRMDITCRGKRVVRILEVHQNTPNRLYLSADLEFVKTDTTVDYMKSMEIIEKLAHLYELLRINREIPSNPADLRSFEIGHHVGFSVNQEYQLLTIETEAKRQAMILDHLTDLIPMIEETERLRERVRLNGHFKNIIPPKV